ncbi:conserved hypothetical protein [Verticillium alfalfae VaMs.102]|uniref:Intradiol ring-cleavage dioxygenases domain-containing protein n=1 Tax=Verticillium alfalfae (strain VaMs.102 / ATCC MYA-4576 / FGSC 10136) TaxID=526221 RepID=C9SWR3_VERA1|nr:conserved hypothetical protein [Verticillium alfalfae VaMs.102]EEY23454.1 conserved hypothetical protein [Verticillium alfalfae VaMs.102]
MRLTSVASGIALLSIQAAAHPGHDLSEEIAERRAFLGNIERASLAHCAAKLRARGVEQRNIERRAALLKDAREKLALKKKRDVDTVLATSHNKTELGYTINTDADTLFSGQNSCVLTPEVTQGPYYVGGEYVRRNIIEEQEGVNIVLDYQVIDVDTCEPVPNVYLEMWHCNSTGVYSGVIANGNGDSSDESNIDNTWLRGSSKVTPAVFSTKEGWCRQFGFPAAPAAPAVPPTATPPPAPRRNGTAPDDLTSGVASDASATATSSSTALASETPSGASSTRRAKCKRSRPTSRA